MSRRAVCPAVAWHRQDVHHVHHPDDRQAGVRPAPSSELPAPALRPVQALRPRAGCRGVLRGRHPVLPARRRPAREPAVCARPLALASAACPAVAVQPQAAAGSAWDERGPPPAAVASQVSRVLLRVAAASQAWRAQPRAAAALPGARQAVQAVRAPDAVRLPEAASALRVQRPAARAVQVLRVASGARALRPAAGPDAARLQEAVPADEALRPAVPDVRARLVPAAASAFRPVRVLPSAVPVRRSAARIGRATLRWRTASPSAQSWQAARDEALSCLGVPGGKSGQEGKNVKAEQFGRTMNCQPLGRIVASAESSTKFISTL